MQSFKSWLAAGLPLVFLSSCASRTEFTPDDAPVTVGMPAELSDRERTYVREVDGALRSGGYQPVRNGAGELNLEFRISEGPINTDTRIALRDGRTVLAEGNGRGAGMPMWGRDKVAERSFQQAFGEFQGSLPPAGSHGTPSGGSPAPYSPEEEYVY